MVQVIAAEIMGVSIPWQEKLPLDHDRSKSDTDNMSADTTSSIAADSGVTLTATSRIRAAAFREQRGTDQTDFALFRQPIPATKFQKT